MLLYKISPTTNYMEKKIKIFQKYSGTKNLIFNLLKPRAKSIYKKISPHLNEKDKILDVGAGSCNLTQILKENNYNTKPLDIRNLSFSKNITPKIYNGEKIPYKNNEFDVAIIIFVLHHTETPQKIIEEAKRVSKKIIILEDTYTNTFHKFMTYFFDSLLNLEFSKHPHTNKKDSEWKKIFKKMNLKLIASSTKIEGVFMHSLYILKKLWKKSLKT